MTNRPYLRSGTGWAGLIVLVLAISMAALVSIDHFRSAADKARRAQLALKDVRASAYSADAAVWQAVARHALDVRGLRQFNGSMSSMAHSLGLAADADGGIEPSVLPILRNISNYRRGVELEFSYLQHHDPSTATDIDEATVDPLFSRIRVMLATADRTASDRRASAENAASVAGWSIASGAGLVIVLAWGLFVRARHRALVSEIEQRSLTTQVAQREFEANHDDLTGLLNRRGFFTLLRAHLRQAGKAPAVVILLDLDGFKEINDTLGHGAGDELLSQVGPRLKDSLREHDHIARLGGDEFAILMTELKALDESIAAELAQRVRSSLGTPFAIGGLSLQARASIGVALFPTHGPDAEELIRRADIAMYQAKSQGTGVAVYAAGDDPGSRDRLQLASDLEDAIATGQLVVHYQPKANLSTGAIDGVEALVRWQHPEKGLIGPDTFVTIAERSGLIRQLTLEVVDQALAQQAAWRAEGIELDVAANLSVANLLDANLAGEIGELLERHKAKPERVRLEITESFLLTDPTRMHDNLQKLSDLGVRLALDDFGTGYSSFTHLRRLPVDEIKIDRSFVRNLEPGSGDAIIVASTIQLARSLDLCVVAEGVETDFAWQLLRAYGCDLAQGYYLAPPMPAHKLTGWLLARMQDGVPSARPSHHRAFR